MINERRPLEKGIHFECGSREREPRIVVLGRVIGGVALEFFSTTVLERWRNDNEQATLIDTTKGLIHLSSGNDDDGERFSQGARYRFLIFIFNFLKFN